MDPASYIATEYGSLMHAVKHRTSYARRRAYDDIWIDANIRPGSPDDGFDGTAAKRVRWQQSMTIASRSMPLVSGSRSEFGWIG